MFKKKTKVPEENTSTEEVESILETDYTEEPEQEEEDLLAEVMQEEREQKKATQPAKKKKGLLTRFKKKEEEVYVPPQDTKLYLFTEVNKIGIVHYFMSNSIEVAVMSSEVNDIMDTALMEDYPSRLLIIDYGRGKFNDMEYVEGVTGLIEIFADIGYVTVFTCSNLMQNAIKHKFGKSKNVMSKIEVLKYKGAVDIYEHLTEKNETYTISGATDIRPENTLTFKGGKVETIPIEKISIIIQEPQLITDEDKGTEEVLAYR